MAWRPDSQQLASVGIDKVIKLWDANTGLLTEQFTVNNFVYDIAWKLDGSILNYVDGTDATKAIEPALVPSSTPTASQTSTPTPSPVPTVCDFSIQGGDELYLIRAINEVNDTPERFDNICLSTNATYSFDTPSTSEYALPDITTGIAIITPNVE